MSQLPNPNKGPWKIKLRSEIYWVENQEDPEFGF